MAAERAIEAAMGVLAACRARSLRLVTAESCTGGLVAATLTEIPGSSDVVEGGFVTYADEAKEAMLGVPRALLAAHGAVSEPVVRAMAEGALARSERADIAVAITGIAGPGGGSAAKPVGLVYIAAARRGGRLLCERHLYLGDRHAVREASLERALALLLHTALEEEPR